MNYNRQLSGNSVTWVELGDEEEEPPIQSRVNVMGEGKMSQFCIGVSWSLIGKIVAFQH